MAHFIITGASGFIGLPTVKILLAEGNSVTALSRRRGSIEHEQLNWIETDLSNSLSIAQALDNIKADALVHLAWQGIPDFSLPICQRNLTMGQDIITKAVEISDVQRVVVTGSCFEYNRQKGACSEQDRGSARDHFTWSKLALLEWAQMFTAKHDIELGWMRIFYAYGPNQRAQSLIPSLISSIRNNQIPDIRTPSARNDFVYVDDVARAVLAATKAPSLNGIYNIGSGQTVSIYDICRIVNETISGSTNIADSVLANATQNSETNFWADLKNTNTDLNWSARTSLALGICEMCN